MGVSPLGADITARGVGDPHRLGPGSITMFNLGPMPLVNNLYDTADAAESARRHPLNVVMDGDLVAHLDHQVPPDEMYANYLYRSAVGAPYVEHCKRMWRDLAGLKPRRIIDIGGNDGTLLAAFQSQSAEKLDRVNVDASASVGPENLAKGIRYVNAYWGDADVGKADVIVSTNVFQHTADVDKFLRGIQKHLDGVWVLEFPYFFTTLLTNQFDQIYHEHYYYWLVTPLVKLFKKYGLTITSISEQEIHGGSLRIISTNKPLPDRGVHEKFVAQEAAYDYTGWAARMRDKIERDRAFFKELKSTSTIAGFGAAAKGCIYLNAVGCHAQLDYVVDDTPQKQGKFIPGTRLEVVPRERLFADQPDCLVVLAHNFKDYIATSLRPHYKGRIVAMIPEFAQVDRT